MQAILTARAKQSRDLQLNITLTIYSFNIQKQNFSAKSLIVVFVLQDFHHFNVDHKLSFLFNIDRYKCKLKISYKFCFIHKKK